MAFGSNPHKYHAHRQNKSAITHDTCYLQQGFHHIICGITEFHPVPYLVQVQAHQTVASQYLLSRISQSDSDMLYSRHPHNLPFFSFRYIGKVLTVYKHRSLSALL